MTTEPTQTSPAATPENPSPTPAPTQTQTPATTDPAASLFNQGEQPPAVQDPAAQQPTQPTTAEFVPLTFDAITIPEGIEINDGLRNDFLGIMNNQEMTPAQRAQALVDLQSKAAQEASEAGSHAWTELQTNWQNEVRGDADLGGAKLEGTLAGISKVLDQFGTPEVREIFNHTGAGNNIHMVRFLHNISKHFAEGAPISGSPADTPKSAADIMYGGKK